VELIASEKWPSLQHILDNFNSSKADGSIFQVWDPLSSSNKSMRLTKTKLVIHHRNGVTAFTGRVPLRWQGGPLEYSMEMNLHHPLVFHRL
jgi:hypothetical protein